MPIQAEMTVTPQSLVIATSYGFRVALLFTLWPLGRVEQVSASMLFRDEVAAGANAAAPRRDGLDGALVAGAVRLRAADIRTQDAAPSMRS